MIPALLLFASQEAGTRQPEISAVIAYESDDREEIKRTLGFRGVLTEGRLAALPKEQYSYRQLPSKRYAVAYWSKEFATMLAQKTTFLKSVARMCSNPKPMRLGDFPSEERSLLVEFVKLQTSAVPDENCLLTAGTLTSANYEYNGKRYSVDRSSSVPKLNPESYQGDVCKPVDHADLLRLGLRMGDLFAASGSSHVTTQSWVNYQADGLVPNDMGEAVKFYMSEKKSKMQPLYEITQKIIESSKELTPPAQKPIPPEMAERIKKAQAKYNPGTLAPGELQEKGTLVSIAREIRTEIVLNAGGTARKFISGFRVSGDWLPKPKS